MAAECRQQQGGIACGVARIDLGALLDQVVNQFRVPVARRQDQQGVALAVGAVNRGTAADQLGDVARVAHLGGIDQVVVGGRE